MGKFQERIRFGFSPSMLFPEAFDDEKMLYTAYRLAEQLPEYEALESFLPDGSSIRADIIKMLRRTGKILNYNTPAYFQVDGEFNLCSDSQETREHAYEAMRRHLGYAAEAGCPLFIVTGCRDKGEEYREELKKRFADVFARLCKEAEQYGMRIVMEPIERHRFKQLIYGPTSECADFIRSMRGSGLDNCGLMLDIAHLPLMEEKLEDAIKEYSDTGLWHVHLGNAVLAEDSCFFGHTHPPLGVHKGEFSQEDLAEQFRILEKCGYISEEGPRASISLEVRPYPGVSELTSIRAMYEQCVSAFEPEA